MRTLRGYLSPLSIADGGLKCCLLSGTIESFAERVCVGFLPDGTSERNRFSSNWLEHKQIRLSLLMACEAIVALLAPVFLHALAA